MAESRKIKRYRETLQDITKPQSEERHKVLEGRAAKLGTENYGEERKGKPKTKSGGKPRR